MRPSLISAVRKAMDQLQATGLALDEIVSVKAEAAAVAVGARVEALNATLNAATSGTRHVLQHPETGAVLSARTGFWTYSLGEAYGVTPEGPAVLGAVVVPVPTAREVMLGKLEAA